MSIVFVTGSSTGIGMATAVTLARAGHTVYAGMRTPARVTELHETNEREKLGIRIVTQDVDGDESAVAGIRQALAESGRIDVLVNNAGIGMMGAVEDMPLAEFRAIMETNYFGAIRCIQAVLPGMRERRSGLIVNVTSVAGRLGTGAQSAYCGSKWALEAASEALAQEVKSFGIRVAIVEPGVIATPIFGKTELERPSKHYPHSRRLAELFRASLEKPVSPFVVGEKIREIMESGTWTLRHPAGPDAAGLLGWRQSLSDEQWADWGALSDAEWVSYVREHFGLPVALE